MADQTNELPAVEQEAMQMGWVPEERFKGDPDRWVDAETFVTKGREVLPILRHTNAKLQAEVSELKQGLNSTQEQLRGALEAMEAFKQYHEEDSKRQYELAVKNLKADKVSALEEGNHAAVVEIDEALETLKEKSKQAPVQKPVAPAPRPDATQDPIFQAWVRDNRDWFEVDKEKTAYAVAQGHFVRMTQPDLVGQAFFQRISELVEEKYAPTTRRVDKMEGSQGGSQGRRSGSQTYNDLPAEAKAACDRFGSKLCGPGKAYATEADWRKHYAVQYFGDQR
eukprot:GHVR01136337.1.p1 GENE.GHVR01136337.1~~GHVR01136337.1.p1  ORF type:complete len:281 (+),score=42.03 GHVR01136337.1:341-1183(+)